MEGHHLPDLRRIWDDNVGLVAAGVAFYGFFALLSLLGLIVLAYGFAADPFTVIEHMRALTAVLPTDVAFVIGDQLMNAVQASQKTKGLGILLAFLVATYGGTNGAASVITALNIAYEEKEKQEPASLLPDRGHDDARRAIGCACRTRGNGRPCFSPASRCRGRRALWSWQARC